MWMSIERNLKNGITFKELPRIFLLQYNASHKLRLTRPNVVKTEELISWTEWKKQDYFVDDIEAAQANFDLLEKYRKNTNGFELDHGGVNHNFYVHDVPFNEFISDVVSKFIFKENDTFNIAIFNKLLSVIKVRKLDDLIDLCWVRYDWLKEERGINDDLTFKPPFYRGRDTKMNSRGTYDYNGDRSTCDERPNKIQIQIHYLKAKNKPEMNFISPVICIYIPEKYASRLVKVSE